MKIRMSKSQAKAKALSVAEELLRTEETRGWKWRCVDARPDPLAPFSKKKVQAMWIVVVEWFNDSGVLDGPSIISVDVRHGIATLRESP